MSLDPTALARHSVGRDFARAMHFAGLSVHGAMRALRAFGDVARVLRRDIAAEADAQANAMRARRGRLAWLSLRWWKLRAVVREAQREA